MKHFKRGQVIAEKDIHRVITQNGNHMVTQACLDTLMDTWNKGDYNYLVMIVDGAMATCLSGGSSDAVFDQILAHRLTDAQYIARRKYAEQLAGIKILYLSAPRYTGDYVLYWDAGNKTSSYAGKKQYWSTTKDLEVKSTAAIGYWHSHFYIEGMAFYAPEYYLTITDPGTGKVILDTAPEVKDIPLNTEQIVYYDQAKTVAERMGDIRKQIVPVTVSMKDVLADGLEFRSVSVEYSADNGKTWTDVPSNLRTVTFDEGTQTVTAKIDISDKEFAKSRFRFLIRADVTAAFGETVGSGKTNEECIVEYPDPEDPEKPPIDEYEPESPVVTFTTFDVFYQPGDHGTLTGQSKETFRKYAKGNQTTGSSVSPDTHYVHTGWTCDDNVTLTDGSVIEKGELLSNEQITLVVPTHTVTFTAQYETEKRKVTYVVEPDPKWGIPKDSATPAEREYHIGTEVTVEDPLRSASTYAYDDQTHKEVNGLWRFNGWDTEDFIIYDDTVITGAWEFTPFAPPPTGDNNRLTVYSVCAILCAGLIIASGILHHRRRHIKD